MAARSSVNPTATWRARLGCRAEVIAEAAAGFEKIDLANGGGDLSGGRVFLQAPADTGGRLPLAARGAESPRPYSGRVRDRGAGVAEARRARSATSAGSGRPPGTREVQGA